MTAHIANTRYALRPCPSPGAPPTGAGPLAATDALVLAVRDARRAAHHYRTALGLHCTAYTGPETGNPQLRAYVLEAAAPAGWSARPPAPAAGSPATSPSTARACWRSCCGCRTCTGPSTTPWTAAPRPSPNPTN
ncbi:hypothetical protein ACFQ1I_17845 [Kitasatospora arboriphila]